MTGASPARADRADAAGPPVTVPRSETIDLVAASGAPYRLLVSHPAAPPPPAGYPVIYAVDGNAVFGTLTDIVAFAGLRPRPGSVPPAMVVAIGYPDADPLNIRRRSTDLTPPAEAFALPERPNGAPWPPMGGADAFLDFIERDVKPLIASRYKVDEGRETLVGHSFGGLFVLHTLFTRPGSFDAYLAASPSIWFNDRWVEREAETFRANPAARATEARVFIGVGALEQAPEPATVDGIDPEARRRWLAKNRMVDNARAMADRLDGTPGLTTCFAVFDDEDHGSVLPVFLSRALRFALSAAPAC